MERAHESVEKSGKFSIQFEINGGMNAYTYKARHNHLGSDIFLKVYDYVNTEKTILREPQLLFDITSSEDTNKFIVKVFDVDIVDEFVSVAMELINGGSILERICDTNLGFMDAIDIAKKILMGLSHLHEKNILHRDLKPGNIMLLENEAGEFIPKISDFGSAIRIEEKDGVANASRHSALYTPTESWEKGQYCVSSDLYQVGITLFEMINGCLPYNDDAYLDKTGKKELKKHAVNSLDELDDFERTTIVNGCLHRRAASSKILSMIPHKPYYSGRIKKIIKKATNPKREQRYGSVGAFLGDLAEISVPNWVISADGYSAKDWKELDWIVVQEKNIFCAKSCKPNTNKYRKKYSGTLEKVLDNVAKHS